MTHRLTVAHVVLTLDVGGLERNVVNQVHEGRRLGQRVVVVCLERPGVLSPEVEAHGGAVVCVHKRPGLRPEALGSLRGAFRRIRPDVVHTHQIGSLLYGGLAARSLGVPLIVHTEHGKQAYARRRRTLWLGRVAGTLASRFYCLSADMANEVVARRVVPRRKVHVIGNGIDTARFQARGGRESMRVALGIPADAPVVGTVGRLTEVKRQDLLLHAFARLRARVPTAHLMVVGEGPLRSSLQDLAARLGLAGAAHFTGYQAETERFYPAMDVFALTSRSEGIPQAVLEASVAGLPVVASRVGGVPEVIEDGQTGLLFSDGDEDALTTRLALLFGDGDRARRLGAAGRERVAARFDVRLMAETYHRHFLELLRRVGGPNSARSPAFAGPGGGRLPADPEMAQVETVRSASILQETAS
jgi:glycosyltransferase involved in cell wall biosynthesis